MKLQSLSISLATGLVLVAACSTSCALSTKVRVTSEPSGARVWVGDQRGGVTPTEVRLRATGPLRHSTFEPEYVTVDADGYARETVIPDYEWSIRNVVLSIPLVLGVPGVLLWSKMPTDVHVVLEPAEDR